MNMDFNHITIEYISDINSEQLQNIERSDVSESFVDSLDSINAYTNYGLEHHLKGHTYLIKYQNELAGILLIGEGIAWETDPIELKDVPFYRLMDFIIVQKYRNIGLGSFVIEKAITNMYEEFGVRPIVLGVHKENIGAEKFYYKHGFVKTNYMDGDDYYFIRWT